MACYIGSCWYPNAGQTFFGVSSTIQKWQNMLNDDTQWTVFAKSIRALKDEGKNMGKKHPCWCVRLRHAAEEQKSEVPGSSGILWLKIIKAIFIFNITTLSSDHMPFSFVDHVDCIIISLVSSAKCVCPGKHGSNIIYVESFATAAPTAPNYIISFRWILDY